MVIVISSLQNHKSVWIVSSGGINPAHRPRPIILDDLPDTPQAVILELVIFFKQLIPQPLPVAIGIGGVAILQNHRQAGIQVQIVVAEVPVLEEYCNRSPFPL
jgi:hypothetical protein